MAQPISAILKSREMIGYIIAAVIGWLVAAAQGHGSFGLFLDIICAYGFAAIWCGFLFMRRRKRARRAAGQIDVNVHVYRNADEQSRQMMIQGGGNFMFALLSGFVLLPGRIMKIVNGTAEV